MVIPVAVKADGYAFSAEDYLLVTQKQATVGSDAVFKLVFLNEADYFLDIIAQQGFTARDLDILYAHALQLEKPLLDGLQRRILLAALKAVIAMCAVCVAALGDLHRCIISGYAAIIIMYLGLMGTILAKVDDFLFYELIYFACLKVFLFKAEAIFEVIAEIAFRI